MNLRHWSTTMKAADIKVGGRYKAKVSGNLVTVRVDAIRDSDKGQAHPKLSYVSGGRKDRRTIYYDVTNLATGRKTTFRSAAKFRGPADLKRDADMAVAATMPEAEAEVRARYTPAEDEQRPDPTPTSSAAAAAAAPRRDASATSDRPSINAKLAAARAAEAAKERDAAPHLIVLARAGTGKTTTLVEGLKVLRGLEPRITPSEQQRAVWDSILLSRGKADTVGFVAFNKSIATELQERVPPGVEAMTMHSLGNKAVTAAFGRVQLNQWRVRDIIAELTGMDGRQMQRDHPVLVKAVEELVGLCKMNLVGQDFPPADDEGEARAVAEFWTEALDQLARHYDVEMNGQRARAFELVPRVLDRCKDVKRDGKMDFNDMIWLPVVLNLPVRRYDLLLVDEAQDLNRCQQALAKRAGRRLILVGDDRQAIYGFAGADSESLPRMQKELGGGLYDGSGEGAPLGPGNTAYRGCVTLPLTVTRRCGKAIVEEARRYVPDFEAHPDNPPGTVGRERFPGKRKGPNGIGEVEVKWEESYGARVEDGDFVLCRTNAPLVNQCFRFIRLGRKANIQGRDVAAGLTSTVKKMEGKAESIPVPELISKLDDWLAAETAKEQAKRNPSENKLQSLQDRHECLTAFADGAATSLDVRRKIDQVFTDDKTITGVRLSSVHRAKGLEARRVFWLRGDGSRTFGPPPDRLQLWELGQEENLAYVATTRAIEELVHVS